MNKPVLIAHDAPPWLAEARAHLPAGEVIELSPADARKEPPGKFTSIIIAAEVAAAVPLLEGWRAWQGPLPPRLALAATTADAVRLLDAGADGVAVPPFGELLAAQVRSLPRLALERAAANQVGVDLSSVNSQLVAAHAREAELRELIARTALQLIPTQIPSIGRLTAAAAARSGPACVMAYDIFRRDEHRLALFAAASLGLFLGEPHNFNFDRLVGLAWKQQHSARQWQQPDHDPAELLAEVANGLGAQRGRSKVNPQFVYAEIDSRDGKFRLVNSHRSQVIRLPAEGAAECLSLRRKMDDMLQLHAGDRVLFVDCLRPEEAVLAAVERHQSLPLASLAEAVVADAAVHEGITTGGIVLAVQWAGPVE